MKVIAATAVFDKEYLKQSPEAAAHVGDQCRESIKQLIRRELNKWLDDPARSQDFLLITKEDDPRVVLELVIGTRQEFNDEIQTRVAESVGRRELILNAGNGGW